MLSPVKLWRNQKKKAALAGKTGTVVSYTVIRVPTAGFSNQAPYPVAVVDLDSGERVVVQLVDCGLDEVKIGLKVRTVIRRVTDPDPDSVIPYGIKAKPVMG